MQSILNYDVFLPMKLFQSKQTVQTLMKVSFKILNSGILLKTFIYVGVSSNASDNTEQAPRL